MYSHCEVCDEMARTSEMYRVLGENGAHAEPTAWELGDDSAPVNIVETSMVCSGCFNE